MNYKKYLRTSSCIFIAGAVLSAVISVVMMFIPDMYGAIGVFPWLIASTVNNCRTLWLTGHKGYDQEQYLEANKDMAMARPVLIVMSVCVVITFVLFAVKIFVY